MKIKYLGTAAAEAIPALFCDCHVCEKARRNGGKDIRTRSQSLIDGGLLIDFPADTLSHVIHQGLDLQSVEALLITHTHQDHFYPQEFQHRAEPFAHSIEKPLDVYGNDMMFKTATKMMDEDRHGESMKKVWRFHMVNAFEPFLIGKYRVTALKARHDPTQNCYVYLIEKGNQSLLYAHDTGLFEEETWSYLAGKRLDLVSMDCTMMALDQNHYHMGFSGNIEMAKKLRELNCAHKDTVFVCNHFSHNGLWSHDQLVEKAKSHGFLATYDGLEIEF